MDAFLAERGELHNNHTMTMMRTPQLPNNQPDDDKDVDKGKDDDGQQRQQRQS
jgi:hypothetical protein